MPGKTHTVVHKPFQVYILYHFYFKSNVLKHMNKTSCSNVQCFVSNLFISASALITKTEPTNNFMVHLVTSYHERQGGSRPVPRLQLQKVAPPHYRLSSRGCVMENKSRSQSISILEAAMGSPVCEIRANWGEMSIHFSVAKKLGSISECKTLLLTQGHSHRRFLSQLCNSVWEGLG